jgi:hypothetical protein
MSMQSGISDNQINAAEFDNLRADSSVTDDHHFHHQVPLSVCLSHSLSLSLVQPLLTLPLFLDLVALHHNRTLALEMSINSSSR